MKTSNLLYGYVYDLPQVKFHMLSNIMITNRNHEKHWEPTARLKQAKGLIPGPSARRMKDLLKLNTDQLRWVV
jgi:hypothetical protein